MSACISSGLLEGYCRGEAPVEQRRFVEAHCADCASCRRSLGEIALASPPTSVEELAAEAELLSKVDALRPPDRLARTLLAGQQAAVAQGPLRAQPVQSPLFRWPRWGALQAKPRFGLALVVGGFAVAASLGLMVVLPDSSGAPPDLQLPFRATEGRPALVHLGHAPFVPQRGEDRNPPEYDDALGWLLSRPSSAKAKTTPYLAALYLWRGEQGDRVRAEAALRATPESPRRDNDVGVLLLANGESEGALMAFSAALEKEPTLLEALFNRGLALEALGRKADAAQAWNSYLARATGDEEEPWTAEARRHLDTLSQGSGEGAE